VALTTESRNGFSLHGAGARQTNVNLFSFYFLGGQADYKFLDATGETRHGDCVYTTGLRNPVAGGSTVGTPANRNTYTLFVANEPMQRGHRSDQCIFGRLRKHRVPGSVLLYNNNRFDAQQ